MMKTNLFMFCAILAFNCCFSHTDEKVEAVYGNVKVTAYASRHVEMMNNALIIGQYSKMMCSRLGYSESLNLYFYEADTTKIDAYYLSKKRKDNEEIFNDRKNFSSEGFIMETLTKFEIGTIISLRLNYFDIAGSLNVIEQSIKDRKQIYKHLSELSILYQRPNSQLVSEIVEQRIERPNIIEKLEKPTNFSYYFQNGTFHFYQPKDNKWSMELEKFLDYFVLNPQLLVTVDTANQLRIVQPANPDIILNITNGDQRYKPFQIHLLGGNKLVISSDDWTSRLNKRVLVYFLDKAIFLQDIDSCIKN